MGEALRSGRVHLNRRLRGCGRAGFTRPRAHARGYTKPRLRRSIRKTCSRGCLADLGQPRLRRSPLNHNTAGGQDFQIDFPRGPARDSSLAANPASAWRPLPENAKHMPGGSPGFEWSREAAAAFSRGRKPMEYGTPPPSRVGGDSNHSWWLISGKSGPRPAVRIIRGKTADRKTNHEWTRINTNRPEDGWTSFNGKRRQNASAILCPWCDPVMGGSPPGSAGVPPAQILV